MANDVASLGLGTLGLWVAGFFGGLTVVSVAVGYGMERAFHQRRIWALPLDPGQTRHELLGNVMFLVVAITSFTATLGSGVIRFGDESLVRWVGTFLALSFGFQAYYYGLHRLLHRRALVRFHRWHHVSRVTTPLSGQSMGAVEALGWMIGYLGLPLAFSFVAPISFGGWMGYMAFNVFGNIVGHANVEASPRTPWMRGSTLFVNVFVYHALHHARWTGHYSFAAALMDRLCHTEWSDWPTLYERVIAGRPLTTLRERCDTTDAQQAAGP